METFAPLFAALGHPDRLAALQMMMRLQPHALRPTELALRLGLRANTLSHHLSAMAAAGVVRAERRGRSIHYAPNRALIGQAGRALLADGGIPVSGAGFAPEPDPTFSQPVQVLFICTGNAARSQMAEAILRHLGGRGFVAHSAGVEPKPQINPDARALLVERGLDVGGLQPKPLTSFLAPDAPRIDVILTLCDDAATCLPVSAGPQRQVRAHWGLADRPGTKTRFSPPLGQSFDRLWTAITALTQAWPHPATTQSVQAHVNAIALDLYAFPDQNRLAS